MNIRFFYAFCLLLVWGATALAGDLIIYPKKNQNAEQQQKDKSECYTWARQESGFDPMAVPRTETVAPGHKATQGGLMRGAVRGAILGEIVDDDAGKGAAAGAAIGGMRRRDQVRQQEQERKRWEQEEAAKYAQKRQRYDNAYKVCLEARDYAVS